VLVPGVGGLLVAYAAVLARVMKKISSGMARPFLSNAACLGLSVILLL
jgi:hypothetical protein